MFVSPYQLAGMIPTRRYDVKSKNEPLRRRRLVPQRVSSETDIEKTSQGTDEFHPLGGYTGETTCETPKNEQVVGKTSKEKRYEHSEQDSLDHRRQSRHWPCACQ